MRQRIAQTLLRYLIAFAAVGLTIPIKLMLQPWLEAGTEREAPFILSLAAVMFTGWYGGLGPALLATALGAATGSYFFMHPYNDFTLRATPQRLRLILFLIAERQQLRDFLMKHFPVPDHIAQFAEKL